MEFFINLFKMADSLGKTSPVVAGFVAMAMTGILGFIVIKAPKHILTFIQNACFVSFEVNNTGWGKNQEIFLNTIRWFYEFKGFKITRSFAYEGSSSNVEGTVGAGAGRHFIFYKGVPLFWKIFNIDSSGSEKQKKAVCVKTLFFLKKPFFKFIKEITSDKNTLFIPGTFEFIPNERYWRRCNDLTKRDINTVILNKGVKEELISIIDDFYKSEQWYKERGIPYKLVILLYGQPGTGKTSIIKSLASHFNKNVCPVYLHSLSDSSFVNAVNNLPKESFMIMEDVDASGSVAKRQETKSNVGTNTTQLTESKILDEMASGGLNLSTILNTIDGVAELNKKVIFFSTNHPEKLDKAFYRAQRVDKCIPIFYLNQEAVERYAAMAYPEDFTKEGFPTFDKQIPGSVLQEIFMMNKFDYKGFLNSLNEKVKNGIISRDLEKLNF